MLNTKRLPDRVQPTRLTTAGGDKSLRRPVGVQNERIERGHRCASPAAQGWFGVLSCINPAGRRDGGGVWLVLIVFGFNKAFQQVCELIPHRIHIGGVVDVAAVDAVVTDKQLDM